MVFHALTLTRSQGRSYLKTEGEAQGLQHLPRDLAKVNALKNHAQFTGLDKQKFSA